MTNEHTAPLDVLRRLEPWMDQQAIVDRLFVELDAALARAEAAGREQRVWYAHAKESLHGKLAAESRLAKATALLERHEGWPVAPELRRDTRAFLSTPGATPAPAASVLCHPTDPCAHGITGPCSRCQPSPAAESEPDPIHRVLNNRCRGKSFAPYVARIADLEAAHSEEFANHGRTIDERNAALSRIADLERERDTLSLGFNQAHERESVLELELAAAREENERMAKGLDICSAVHGHNVKLVAERDALRAAIDAAVVELGTVGEMSPHSEYCVGEALSLLRAAQSGGGRA